ncbi:MAG: hypothetical protein LBR64_05045 [Dysgonamonadaceae bacterium]|jgi:hypothetical protein|nr:hypothetical protein [Dysgonamonadaceae bacterium]
MATTKKVTHVEGGSASTPSQQPRWTPTAEAKSAAGKNRMYAVILWVLAVVAEIAAMVILSKKDPEVALTTGQNVLIISILFVDLILLVAGSSFWKNANRLDPPSKASAMFAVQSQAGVIMAAVCFVPVLIQAIIKKAWFVVAAAAIFGVGGGAASADYKPASQEEYAQQSSYVTELMGSNHVYWTKSGTKYHLYDDCQYLKSDRTTEIFEGGTVADAYANNSKIKPEMNSLCSACEKRAAKEKGWTDQQLQEAKDKAIEAAKNGAAVLEGALPAEEPQPEPAPQE